MVAVAVRAKKPAGALRRRNSGSGGRRRGTNGGRDRRLDHAVEWRSPAPLWDAELADPDSTAVNRPAILRFAGDDFMETLADSLQSSPDSLLEYVAQPETWRQERAGWLPSDDERWEENAFKLYQPSQNRFYLIAADLVCRIPGLPGRAVDQRAEERVSFVIRRLVPVDPESGIDLNSPPDYQEEAWGPWDGGRWQPVDSRQKLAVVGEVAEERVPLFSLSFELEGQKRRVLAGLIPTASRETYEADPASNPVIPPGTGGEEDPRPTLFETRVYRPLKDLLRGELREDEVAQASTFILLDFAEFLHDGLPGVWAEVGPNSGYSHSKSVKRTARTIEEKKLIQRLQTEVISGEEGDQITWSEALTQVWGARELLLAGSEEGPLIPIEADKVSTAEVESLKSEVDRAIEAAGAYKPPQGRDSAANEPPDLPKFDPEAGAYYVVRCVYERPRCGDLHPPLVSEASRPFQIASFFDPDAPARPVRISLPTDTSISGLRKFKRNVSFFASKQLRSQMERLRGVGFGDLEEDGPGKGSRFDLGMVCSLSIPIITICALVLLMIIVQLLNIVFWWLPFFKICFPVKRP